MSLPRPYGVSTKFVLRLHGVLLILFRSHRDYVVHCAHTALYCVYRRLHGVCTALPVRSEETPHKWYKRSIIVTPFVSSTPSWLLLRTSKPGNVINRNKRIIKCSKLNCLTNIRSQSHLYFINSLPNYCTKSGESVLLGKCFIANSLCGNKTPNTIMSWHSVVKFSQRAVGSLTNAGRWRCHGVFTAVQAP